MTEFAVIDIGSNSIRYGEERAGAIPDKEVFTTRLGSGLSSTGLLAEETMARSLEVLISLGNRARSNGFTPAAYATSAVRDARNGAGFARLVEEKCGFPVEILPGESEARYAFIGAAGNGFDTMLDIGGASMQVVRRDFGVSFRAGCVRCGDIARQAACAPDCDTEPYSQQAAVEAYMDSVIELPGLEINGLVGVGGSITTLAALHAGLTRFDREAVDSVTLDKGVVRGLIRSLIEMGDAGRRAHPLLLERHDVILYGAYILLHALELLKTDSLGVSCSDGMEGYLKILKAREGLTGNGIKTQL